MLKASIVKELQRIVGPDNLLASPEHLLVYSYDATRNESLPDAVARPRTAEEVSAILKLANREKFPVTPRGAGSGMSGGSVPVNGGIALSFERMNSIISIDDQELIAEVEPGVVTGDLQKEVEKRGLFYPPDPASSKFCTIGGNVAECAGGLRAVKYGVTRDYILGLEAVLPTGEFVRTGAKTRKSVAGYDLTRLLVGSEGTLAVVTKITLKLLPLPESTRTLVAYFPDVHQAAAAAQAVNASRVLPRALEIVDAQALHAVESYLKQDISNGAGAMLLAETDGPVDVAMDEIESIADRMRSSGAVRLELAATEDERERLWKARRSISAALYALKPRKLNEDIVVPRSRIADFLKESSAISRQHGIMIVNFGHAGDGNIHTNVMFDEADRPKAEAAVKEVLSAALKLGGSITGEHGIGMTKSIYLPMEADAGALGAMKKIKDALDPNGILNPGKIFASQE